MRISTSEEGCDANRVVLCDSCDSEYHMDCLKPPMTDIPEGEWFCPQCCAFGNGTCPKDTPLPWVSLDGAGDTGPRPENTSQYSSENEGSSSSDSDDSCRESDDDDDDDG